jgi:hypothetical protein
VLIVQISATLNSPYGLELEEAICQAFADGLNDKEATEVCQKVINQEECHLRYAHLTLLEWN